MRDFYPKFSIPLCLERPPGCVPARVCGDELGLGAQLETQLLCSTECPLVSRRKERPVVPAGGFLGPRFSLKVTFPKNSDGEP